MLLLNIVIFVFSLFLFHQQLLFVHSEINNIRYLNSVDTKDLPIESDLAKYLNIVDRAVQYSFKNKNALNIQLAFGIFITVVNMKHVLKYNDNKIPVMIKIRIENMISQNERLLQYFRKHVVNVNPETVRISSLFANSSIWIPRMYNFTYTCRNVKSMEILENHYMQWDQYIYSVDHMEHWKPNPIQSDSCLSALSLNPQDDGANMPLCSISVVCKNNRINGKMTFAYMRCWRTKLCYNLLKTGNNFGYALLHRLLLLIIARNDRGCSIFSEQEDKEISKKICSMAYDEAEYISLHNYGHPDLMLEIILLCSLEGHSEFLRRTWLENLRNFEKDGCFSIRSSLNISSSVLFIRKNKLQLNKVCNVHMTALVMGTFSSAIRYILQERY